MKVLAVTKVRHRPFRRILNTLYCSSGTRTCCSHNRSATFWTNICLKGQCHEIFLFCFFSSIIFPPAPENSRRYSQLKVDHRCQRHRWQMRKIFNQKNFNDFVGTPLDSRVNTYIHFCLQVHFKVSAAWYCCHYLPPVSTTLVKLLAKICRRCRWYRQQFCHRCHWRRWQICHRCRWYRWSTLSCK